MLILGFTGAMLYQLCNLAFFLNAATHSEGFPTTWFLCSGFSIPGGGAGTESRWWAWPRRQPEGSGQEAEGEESGFNLKVSDGVEPEVPEAEGPWLELGG